MPLSWLGRSGRVVCSSKRASPPAETDPSGRALPAASAKTISFTGAPATVTVSRPAGNETSCTCQEKQEPPESANSQSTVPSSPATVTSPEAAPGSRMPG